MATKRDAKVTVRKSAKRKVAPELTEGAVMAVLETAATITSIDPADRRQLVAKEAYYLAERRGFAPGSEVEDWVAAEAMVESRLRTRVA